MSDHTLERGHPPSPSRSGRDPNGWDVARSATAIVLVVASPLLIAVAGAAGEEWTPPAGLAVVLAAIAGVGAAMLTGGTLAIRTAVRQTRQGHPAVRGAVVVAALVVVAAAPTVARAGGGSGTAVARVAPVVALMLVVGHWWWSRAGPYAEAAPRRSWLGASTLVAGFLAASMVTIVLALPDVYPLSRYPMYSQPRIGAYMLEDVAFVATFDDGTSRQLPRPGSRQVLLSLAGADDLDGLEQLARDLAARHEGVVEMAVERRSVAITRHPDPPDIAVINADALTTVEVG